MRYWAGVVFVAFCVAGALTARGQDQVVLGSAAPPSNSAYLVPIIDHYHLDQKHGIVLENRLFTDLSNLYADFVARRTLVTVGGFYNAANFYTKGIPVRLLCTLSVANHAIVTKEDIQSPEQLKGKTIAATTGSGFYVLVQMYYHQHGLDPRQNLSVISAAPPSVQSQLLAGRVDAGVVWEPVLSGMLLRGFHTVGDMQADIRKDLSLPATAQAWFIGVYAWQDWIDQNPQRALALMQMLQDAVQRYDSDPSVDQLIADFTHVPLETLKYSREKGLTSFKVVPAIQEKATIDALQGGFKSAGFIQQVPDAGIYYTWPQLAR
ncbi:MAG TPA: ABC transporter substrate-binding protein [bacterium]|nr:ABC transporter substrate-binding protein [bacterium]